MAAPEYMNDLRKYM